LELGAHSRELHESLAGLVEQAQVDLALLGGAEMAALAQALPEAIPSLHHANVDELLPVLLDTVRPGDVVMIKSSNGIGFSRLVAALLKKFPAAAQAMNTNRHAD